MKTLITNHFILAMILFIFFSNCSVSNLCKKWSYGIKTNNTEFFQNTSSSIVKKKCKSILNIDLVDAESDSINYLTLPFKIDQKFLSYFAVKRSLEDKFLNETDSTVNYYFGKIISPVNNEIKGVLSIEKCKIKVLSYKFHLTTYFKGEKSDKLKIGEIVFLEEEDVFKMMTCWINENFSAIKINSYYEVVDFSTDDSVIFNIEKMEFKINSEGKIKRL